jgi:hypothetical protein
MRYKIQWILTLPFSILLTLVCYITNPLACLFPERQENGRDKLAGIWNMWSTHDNPVDEYYYGGYSGTPPTEISNALYNNSWWIRYCYRLKWVYRNTGYGWGYFLFSIPHGVGFQIKGISKSFLGYHNDYNIGYKSHAGFPRDDFAGRFLGLRKDK